MHTKNSRKIYAYKIYISIEILSDLEKILLDTIISYKTTVSLHAINECNIDIHNDSILSRVLDAKYLENESYM